MDLRQLRSFVAVAEESQFTRAAERLGVKQSSVSAQIRSLEQELGLSLFDRTTRRVALTDAGVLLLARARVLLAGIEDTTSELRRMGGLLVGRVRIGLTTTTGAIDVINLVAAFRTEHPGVELSVVEDISIRLAKQLREDRLDVGILSLIPENEMAGLELLPLATEPLVLVVAPGHPLASQGRASVEQLTGMPLVLPPRGATIRSTVEEAARVRGVTLQIACESIEVGRMKAMVSAGLGVSVLPESDARSAGPEVRLVELTDADLSHTLNLCWRRRRAAPPPARALRDHVRRHFQDDVRPSRQ